jgi:hypothetical protein
MFDILGYLISIIIIAFVTTLAVEFTKRYGFIQKMVTLFETKIKKIAWYQVESVLIALIVLIIFNALNAVTIGGFALILNALIIGFLANGIFTYPIIKDVMLMFKFTAKIIGKIEGEKPVVKKPATKKTTAKKTATKKTKKTTKK